MKIISRRRVEIAIMLLLGLIPLLWFGQGIVVLGHDSGLPLSPVSHFIDRLFTWTVRFGFGNDQTYALPGVFIHGLEALVASLGFGLQSMQKITFVFWFVLPGIAMYYLASKIEEKLRIQFLALFASVFYMINHFLLQGWFVAERTKFSVYAALPILVAILFDWNEGKRKTSTAAILISLTFFFLNGLASLPLFGGVIIVLSVFLVYYLIQDSSASRLKNVGLLIGMTLLFSIFLQSYWLIPFGKSLTTSYSQSVDFFGGKEGILDWVKYVSENSSYSNLIRLQGVPEWYQNSAHPYARIFLDNPLLILVSSALPVLAFLPLLLFRKKIEKRTIIFFSFLSVVSILFIAGAHPPFGVFYVFLMEHIPGFIAFRNPFYKFSPALWLTYSILIGFSISFFVTKIYKHKKSLAIVFYLLIVAGVVLYSFPFLNGSFFDYIKGVRSNRMSVPNYIFEFGKWSEGDSRLTKKTLMLPPPNVDGKVEEYKWGYWSLAPLTSLLTNAPMINDSLYVSKNEQVLLLNLYSMMEKNESGWINLAKILGIDSFVVRRDFVWSNPASPTVNPSVFDEALALDGINKVATFGEWEVYDFADSDTDFFQSSGYSFVEGDVASIPKITTLPGFSYNSPILINGQKNIPSLVNPQKYFLDSKCVMCDLQWKFVNTLQHIPTITQGSFLYPIVSNQQSRAEFELLAEPEKLSLFYSQKVLRDILGLQKSLDESEEVEVLTLILKDILKNSKNLKRLLELNSDSVGNDVLVDLLSFVRTQQAILAQIKDRENVPLNLDNVSMSINSNWKLIEDLAWRTSDELTKKLQVNVQVEDEYDLYYRQNDEIDQKFLSISINNNIKTKTLKEKSNEWYYLGKEHLQKGINRISLEQDSKNQLNLPLISLSEQEDGCYYSGIIDSASNDIFKLTFSHLDPSGNGNLFVAFIPANSNVKNAQSIDSLTSVESLRPYETMYAVFGNKGFQVVICNRENLESKKVSTVEIYDINVRKVAVPDLLFTVSHSDDNISNIDSRKIDNTSYVLNSKLEDSSVLTFLQSYNNNWISDRSTKHFIVNGFANGWILPNGKSEVSIKYKLQDQYKIGVVISTATVIMLALMLIYNRRKK